METGIKKCLKRVIRFLESYELQYVLIGGIANQIWGQARFTFDIDIKVLVPELNYEMLREKIILEFPNPGRPDTPVNPLITSIKIDEIIVDFLFATPGFEEQLIKRATQYSDKTISFYVCTAEDLIIQKAIANRGKDWHDIEGIVIEQRDKLDLHYLKDWLGQFSEVLEKPEILSRYESILKSV